MEYQKLLIAFYFYSLFVQQSQLTYAGNHLCSRDEAFYLLQFKQGVTIGRNVHYCNEDTYAKTFSWNVTGDCCEWDGVTCNGFTGHVIGLDLSSSCLSGTIHANNSLAKLVHLQRLNLAFNELNDFPLGNSISELSSLTHLNLSDSGFLKGKMIPQGLSKLSKLISLDLTWNFIQVGQTTLRSLLHNLTNLEVLLFRNVQAPFELPNNFPSSLRKLSLEGTDMFGNITDSQLFHLPNLQVLQLGWNPLITGTLPNFNWSFSGSILELDFSNTDIFGKVPDSIGNLHSLCYLDLSSNSLSGSIPESFGNLHSLCYLDLSSNSLSGSIPESFGNLTAVTELRLTGNSFTGNVLSSISKLNKLVHLDLSNNHFQGSFPESIGNLTKIIKLTLQCNSFTGTVPSTISKLNKLHELDLSSNNFLGSIPESIGNLTAITKFTLLGNNFTGTVPSTISKLIKLYDLDLSSNHFRGSIPESIGNLTAITELRLTDNSFTGNVPSTIGKLNKLSFISLSSNNFEGSIPDIFGNFSWLDTLNFQSNNFTGPFPYSITTLTCLTLLELQKNLLTGPLPSNISGLQELETLDLSSNYFTGTTPPWLFQFPSLISLSVQANQLTGKLPNELKGGSSKYFSIDLSHNNLHGKIPAWMLSSLSKGSLDISHNFLTGFEKQVWPTMYFWSLNLENNFLQGPLHQSICDLYNLQVLILAQNNFSGSIPGCLGNSSRRISIVDLRMNNFHGEIPIFLSTSLQYLGVYGNHLGGQVPRSLINCTRLVALDLGNNKINDTFPIWLEKLPYLQVLILKSNLFHGPIGDLESEFPFPELRIFDLSCNGFTGTLSSNLFKSFRGMMDVDEEKKGITRKSTRHHTYYLYHVSLVIKGNEFDMRITSIMTSVDLSSNRFEGDIPNSIGNLSSLVLLNLSHNNFRGPIPAEVAKLHELEALDLSWNRLVGEIPGPLSSLTFLEVLNLSYNHLAGRIPVGKQFNTFPNDSYCGNPDLCGFPLSKECGNNNESPLEHDDDDDDDSFFMSGFTWEAVVIGYGCGMIFGLLIGGLMFLLEKPKWYVNLAEDIAQLIAAKKRTKQKKRRQRRGLRMN